MTRGGTVSVEVEAQPDLVFAVLVDIDCLPRWAAAFVDAVEVDAATGRVTGPTGRHPSTPPDAEGQASAERTLRAELTLLRALVAGDAH